jgi:hypothetical protein
MPKRCSRLPFGRLNLGNPELSQRLNAYGLQPVAPYQSVKRQTQPYPGYLTYVRTALKRPLISSSSGLMPNEFGREVFGIWLLAG